MLLLQVVISVGFTAVAMVLTMAGGTGPLKTIPPAVEAAAAENEAPQPPPVVAPADPAEQLFQRSRPQLQRILPWLLAVVGLVNCTYALAASRFRLGLAEFRQLGWQLPSAQHLLLVLLMFVPLSMVCSTLQGWAIQWFPDSGRELAELFGALRHWPLPAVILILAVAPAIGEELLFRGLIGRGLLARHGWFWGMSITSLMFACVHLSPAQVIGVLPLGLVIHLIYATTRSFWAPMLAHFLNNALASVMLKLSDPTAAESAEASGETFDLRLVGLSAIALVFLGCWLWTTRVRFVNPSGVEWNPTEADCGVPASDGDFQREVRRPQVWQVAGSLAAVAALVWLGLQPS
jgi:membrane protease YdiL (CAAX protease family)